MMNSSIQLSPSGKHLENMGNMFQKLYRDEHFTDVTLCCKDGSIRAHKVILATCSPYFHRIFTENDVRGDHPLVIMHGVPFQQLHDLIELIYKGNVKVLPESLDSFYELALEFQFSGILRKDRKQTSETYKNNEGSRKRVVDEEKGEAEVESPEAPTVNKKSLPDNEESSVSDKSQLEFKCNICPKSFKRSSHLTRHKLVHTGERPFACSRCDKTFSRQDRFKTHLRTHREESLSDSDDQESSRESPKLRNRRSWACSQCDKTFSTRKSLRVHLRTHYDDESPELRDERSYACSQCDKTFSKPESLYAHLRIHREKSVSDSDYEKSQREGPKLGDRSLRSYACSQCDKTFSRRESLRAHVRTHHEKSLSDSDDEESSREAPKLGDRRSYACSQCDKTFSRREGLKAHLRTHREKSLSDSDYEESSELSDQSSRSSERSSHSTRQLVSTSERTQYNKTFSETNNDLKITPRTLRKILPKPFVISHVGTVDDPSPELGYNSMAKRPRKHSICDTTGLEGNRPRLNPMYHGDIVNVEDYDLQQSEENVTECAESRSDNREHMIKESDFDLNVEEDLGPHAINFKLLNTQISEIVKCSKKNQ